jgi:transcriptional regulator with XRE-family HTH domain
MKAGAPGSFGAQLRALREAAGFTQEELATIAGLSVHAMSALERGERRRPHVETVRALSAALDLTGATRDGRPGKPRTRTEHPWFVHHGRRQQSQTSARLRPRRN